MITDSYDTSEPIIKIDKMFAKHEKVCDICLVTFSDKIIKYVETNFKCRSIGCVNRVSNNSSVLVFDYEGINIGIYRSSISAPVATMDLLTASQITGATKFIAFGSAGSLSKKDTDNKYVIPTQAYRDEGLSYHYKEASDYIEIKNYGTVVSVFNQLRVPFIQCKVWTTDAVYMETENKFKARLNDGCFAVDMETSALQAVCDFYNYELYSFLQTGDVLSQNGYTKKGLAKANHQTDKLFIALELAKHIN